VTLEALRAIWEERDSRYSGYLRRFLSSGEVRAVIEWRLSEAREIEGPGRDIALLQASRWSPPKPRVRAPWWE
jgi:hypothetical protein